jgi:predicted 3-demethylubiquinone-9 3-methyltransferase (glyoxalase superfamily)
MMPTSKVKPWLWFETQAEEAANFYVSLVPNSRVTEVTRYGPGAMLPEGQVMTVLFELDGRPFGALNGGPHVRFNDAVSISVECDDQAEVDRLWAALSAGGQEAQCGWLKDRYGLSWQIVPRGMNEVLGGPDREGARRATEAMLKMVKLDIGALRRAYAGE